MVSVIVVAVKQRSVTLEKRDDVIEKEQGEMVKKKSKASETSEAEEDVAIPPAPLNDKPYAEDAHEFLKILGRWVVLKSTHPSGYNDYHEVTRKWLEKFRGKD